MAPGADRGGPERSHAGSGRGPYAGRACRPRGPHMALHQVSLWPLPSLSRGNTLPLPKLVFLLFLLEFFDLFAQPTILADIWINYSPVCDSSTPPIIFLNGIIYLEHFGTVVEHVYELACLFLNFLSCFDACFS